MYQILHIPCISCSIYTTFTSTSTKCTRASPPSTHPRFHFHFSHPPPVSYSLPYRRYLNKINARKSRARKLKFQKDLDANIEELQRRVQHLQDKLQQQLSCPEHSLSGDDIQWLVSHGGFERLRSARTQLLHDVQQSWAQGNWSPRQPSASTEDNDPDPAQGSGPARPAAAMVQAEGTEPSVGSKRRRMASGRGTASSASGTSSQTAEPEGTRAPSEQPSSADNSVSSQVSTKAQAESDSPRDSPGESSKSTAASTRLSTTQHFNLAPALPDPRTIPLVAQDTGQDFTLNQLLVQAGGVAPGQPAAARSRSLDPGTVSGAAAAVSAPSSARLACSQASASVDGQRFFDDDWMLGALEPKSRAVGSRLGQLGHTPESAKYWHSSASDDSGASYSRIREFSEY